MPKRKRDAVRTSTEQSPPKSTPFPFLRLPAEIRNLIYEHCLSVRIYHLDFALERSRNLCVNTALLVVNRQVYAEAMPILYSGSMSVMVLVLRNKTPFRQDEVTRGVHSLRNGKQVSMTTYTGQIYPHVLARFRKVILSISVLHLPVVDASATLDSRRLESQLQPFLEALKATLQPSYTGPKVRELKIVADREQAVLRCLYYRTDAEGVAEFMRRRKQILVPFSQLFGLQRVQLVGISDQDFVNELQRIMEDVGPVSQEARQALMRMIQTGI